MASYAIRREYRRAKPYPSRKSRLLEELVELLKRNRYLILFDLHGVSSRVLQEYRYRLRRHGVVLKKAKNTLIVLAMRKVFGELPEEVEERIRGEVGFMFYNGDPFELVRLVDFYKVRRFAKPGDKADVDVVIPSGPTNISPGPILSKFGKLKIPTRVQDGKIFIVRDAVVARAGQEVPVDAIDVLRMLGIRPVYEGLRIIGVIINGRRFVPAEELVLDVNKYKAMLEDASKSAFNLAFNIAYPIPEVLPALISSAHRRAVSLASALGVITRETASALISRALNEALALAQAISARAPELGLGVGQATEEKVEEVKEVEEEVKAEEGPSEEEIAGGLASLFG